MLWINTWKGWGFIKTWFKKIKDIAISSFSNRSFVVGLGIGIIIASLVLSLYNPSKVSDAQVEKRAREMGMKYPDEIKAYFDTKDK